MIFRKAKESDLADISRIMAQARGFMEQNGVVQWVNGYPSDEVVLEDIREENCWVFADDRGVCATVTVLTDGEPDYDKIYDGKWLTGDEGKYIAMHRVAVADRVRGQGVAPKLTAQIKERARSEGFESIRIDTHRDNKAMQRMLTKSGFSPCGIIYLRKNGDERIAFEWLVNAEE
ncbi:MAG: GNAT family N-acetyltransferase [Oscillospiraceae bacterium]|nr:GNAT family N-acetyltransferase [Oscillospiraceae bacterium]